MPTGAPANAPASNTTRACMAVSVPSRRAPILTSNTADGAGVVARKSSVRDITTDTGRRSRRVSAAASGSSSTNFAPKPPPIGVATTFTSCSGRPSTSAISERVKKSACVEVHTVSIPSGSTAASAARGSR
jgi:hypothetical protein